MKNKKFILLLFMPFLLLGCNPTPSNSAEQVSSVPESLRWRLDAEYYTTTAAGFERVSYADIIIPKINNKGTFITYVYSVGCSVCASFEPIFREYLETNNIKAYAVSINEVISVGGDLKKASSYAPYVSLFKAGKINTTLSPTKAEHTAHFKSVTSFGEWLTTYIIINGD